MHPDRTTAQTVLGSSLAILVAPGVCFADPPDFDGDGYADLAIGVPSEDIGNRADAGAINVIYGASAGLTDSGNQFWHQNANGVEDAAETGDQFGFAVAWGDFNGDGFSDLAAGAPGEDVGTKVDAGAVHLFYGSGSGLTNNGDKVWHQNVSGVEDRCHTGDEFGYALTGRDFNGDGFADLAVGVRSEDFGGVLNCGAVAVLYGSASGLRAAGDRILGSASFGFNAAEGDNFAFSVAAGDFNGDGYADLGVGAHDTDIASALNAGAAYVIYGSPTGLTANGAQQWHQNISGIAENAEAADNFGFAVAAGDFDGDGYDDFVVGVPEESVGTRTEAGSVHILYGSASGIRAAGDQLFHQNSTGIADKVEAGDFFGHALGVGDFDGDGFADLAIGARSEDLGSIINAGAAHVLYGKGSGLSASGSQLWHQDSGGIVGEASASENFGDGFVAADFDGDGRDDLAIAVHDEDVGPTIDAGAVNVIYATRRGLRATGNQLWHQDSAGIGDAAEAGDEFGLGLP